VQLPFYHEPATLFDLKLEQYGLVTSVLRTFVIHVETVVHVVVRSGADGTTWMILGSCLQPLMDESLEAMGSTNSKSRYGTRLQMILSIITS